MKPALRRILWVLAIMSSLLIVPALKKTAGGMLFNPEGNTRVENRDVLIAMGQRAQLKRIGEELKVQDTQL